MNYFSSIFVGLCLACIIMAGCSLEEIPPATVADFEVIGGTSQLQGSLVQFDNQSEYVVSESRFVWKFGDGTDTTVTNIDNVSHRYPNTGPFTVELLAYNKAGDETKKDTTIEIVADMADPPIAAFDIDQDECNAPCSIQFTDASEGHAPDKNKWLIEYNGAEDSSFVSAEKTFTLNFLEEGTYIITLTVENESGQTASHMDTLMISNRELRASFEIENDGCQAPCEVRLLNTSANAVRFEWDFMNDNIIDLETDVNDPLTIPFYTENWGEIPIRLVAYNEAGMMSPSFTMIVTVDTPNLPVSSFRIENNYCFAPCEAVIKNFSSFADSFMISYGDGRIWTGNSMPEENGFPLTHIYDDPGEYLITLITHQQGRPYTDTFQDTIIVRDASLMPVAEFIIVGDNCTAPCTVNFSDQSSNATHYLWEFGDGETSMDLGNTSHAYANPGQYNVVLTVSDSLGWSAEKRSQVIIQ